MNWLQVVLLVYGALLTIEGVWALARGYSSPYILGGIIPGVTVVLLTALTPRTIRVYQGLAMAVLLTILFWSIMLKNVPTNSTPLFMLVASAAIFALQTLAHFAHVRQKKLAKPQ